MTDLPETEPKVAVEKWLNRLIHHFESTRSCCSAQDISGTTCPLFNYCTTIKKDKK